MSALRSAKPVPQASALGETKRASENGECSARHTRAIGMHKLSVARAIGMHKLSVVLHN